jgi:Zn-dependent protease with chaperone function/Tfp pilus assembly protein PilE
MNDLVYPKERTLGAITLVMGLLVWLALIIGTFGGALIGLAVGFLLYLFAQSALIAHLRGNGVELSETQYPELYGHFVACCDRLQIAPRPQAYILNGNGVLNAFATKFLGTQYVVLLSNVVDAMGDNGDGLRFYIGHELGHLRMKHLSGHLLRWPVLWLPLLGAAYSRARESTCDRHGLACSGSPDYAVRALAALSAGSDRWKSIDIKTYLQQVNHASGFWMSFHELTAGYPWLTKRAARVIDSNAPVPKRNGFAYVLAIFIPYAGRLGAGFGFLILVYIVGILAAIAIPAYQDYQVRAKIVSAVTDGRRAGDAVARYFYAHHAVPKSLDDAGYLPSGNAAVVQNVSVNPTNGTVQVTLSVAPYAGKSILFVPSLDANEHISWRCVSSEVKAQVLPMECRQ